MSLMTSGKKLNIWQTHYNFCSMEMNDIMIDINMDDVEPVLKHILILQKLT